MGQIYLIRHGQASFGTEDYDRLSNLGIEQGRLLGVSLANRAWRMDAAVIGGLKRHRQTAEACIGALPATLQPTDPWITDMAFDEFDHEQVVNLYRPDLASPGLMKQELEKAENPRRAFQKIFGAAMQRWMSGNHDSEYCESWRNFQGRCIAALRRVAEGAGTSKNIAVFTSGGPIAAICQHLLDLSDRRAFEVNTSLVNCGMTGLLFQPGLISLSFLNNYAHLEPAGQVHVITYR